MSLYRWNKATESDKQAAFDAAQDAVAGLTTRQRSIFDKFYVKPAPFARTRTTTGAAPVLTTTGLDFATFSGVDQAASRRVVDSETGVVTYEVPEGAKQVTAGLLPEARAISDAIELMNTRLKKGAIQAKQLEERGRTQAVSEKARLKIQKQPVGAPRATTVGGRFVDSRRSNALRITGGLN